MYVCVEGHIFEEPRKYIEQHGLDTPPYEEFSVCPCCGETYTEAYNCDCCGEYITGRYIKVDHKRYCDDCYITYEIGDEY